MKVLITDERYDELLAAESAFAALKVELAIQPFAPIEHLASKAADEAWHTLAASDTHPSRKDHVRKAIESAIIAALHSHSKSAEQERDALKLKLEAAKKALEFIQKDVGTFDEVEEALAQLNGHD